MWGAPTTGKTTFLASLSIALLRRGQEWRVQGEDETSTEHLIRLTTRLIGDRAFPPATVGLEHYRWVLVGQLPRTVWRRRRWWWFSWQRREVHHETVRIRLDLVDAQGELAGSKMLGLTAQHDLIDNLVNSSAIVFLYDPVREFDSGDAFDHTFGVLQQMAQRMGGSSGERMPHYVAVCITKFDEIPVLGTAEKRQLLSYDLDPPGFPRVADDDARELFAALCNVSRSGNADLVLNLLEQNFYADRVKFFVTSAIGFYVDPNTGLYDHDDYQNYLPDPAEPQRARIRGSIYPINVVEPILWLGQELA